MGVKCSSRENVPATLLERAKNALIEKLGSEQFEQCSDLFRNFWDPECFRALVTAFDNAIADRVKEHNNYKEYMKAHAEYEDYVYRFYTKALEGYIRKLSENDTILQLLQTKVSNDDKMIKVLTSDPKNLCAADAITVNLPEFEKATEGTDCVFMGLSNAGDLYLVEDEVKKGRWVNRNLAEIQEARKEEGSDLDDLKICYDEHKKAFSEFENELKTLWYRTRHVNLKGSDPIEEPEPIEKSEEPMEIKVKPRQIEGHDFPLDEDKAMKKLPRTGHKTIHKYGNHATENKDLLRASWIFANGHDLQTGLKHLICVAGNFDGTCNSCSASVEHELFNTCPSCGGADITLGWGRIIEVKNNWVSYDQTHHGDYVDVKVILMFKSNSGKILFYEIQLQTKAQADLKKDLHASYSVLRTIFGDPEDFYKVIRKSLQPLKDALDEDPKVLPAKHRLSLNNMRLSWSRSNSKGAPSSSRDSSTEPASRRSSISSLSKILPSADKPIEMPDLDR